jgi:XTP/dITP diphosphohydrolase
MELVFATNNQHKIEEVSHLLKSNFKLLSLKNIGYNDELPETGNTLEANASQKAHYIYEKFSISCFADDTGLEIEALNGKPGVYSARYAGEDKDASRNIEKVLLEMKNSKDRKAIFKTIISLIINDKEYLFEGIIKGIIADKVTGQNGFGYDPVFIPIGHTKSFAEFPMNEKNKISHRAIAVKKLIAFLNNLKP